MLSTMTNDAHLNAVRDGRPADERLLHRWGHARAPEAARGAPSGMSARKSSSSAAWSRTSPRRASRTCCSARASRPTSLW